MPPPATEPDDATPMREDACMVNSEDFETLRAQICASGPASEGDNLLGMEIDSCAFLGDSTYADDDPGLWSGMAVRRSEADQWLITGRATGRTGDAAAIASALSRIWEDHLRYPFRSAHTVVSARDSVNLRAVTQIGPGGFWVTADVRVDLV